MKLTSSCSTNLPPPPTESPSPPNMPLLSPIPGSFLSLCLTSTLNDSLSKNSFKSPSCCNVGWAAVLLSIRSKADRLDSTKFVSNRPTACFSGGGGTTMPGLLACNELYSHKKSLYLRVTVNSGCRYALDDVYVLISSNPPVISAHHTLVWT
jgi:hypothetical protein